jgi:hypothetical protein
MSEGRKHTWALYPSIFMIITTIAALLYLAYRNLFVSLPAATTVEASIASVLVGVIALVLVVAAAFLILDGMRALRKPREERVKAT